MRLDRSLAVLALVLAAGVSPRPASATYGGYDLFGKYLKSAMTVECLGGSLETRCTSLGFQLDVQPLEGDHRVLGVALVHTSPLWDFQQVLSVKNAAGALVSWTTKIIDLACFELAIAYSRTSQPEPLYITMGLSSASTGTAAQMKEVFGYGAKGYEKLDGTTKFHTKGVAVPILPPTSTVPEPISMALLGTGLAGVGVARRRRRMSEAS